MFPVNNFVTNTSFSFHVDLDFEYDESDTATKEIVEKILGFPIANRPWSNCLNRPIRNTRKVNTDDFGAKTNKSLVKYDADPRGLFTRLLLVGHGLNRLLLLFSKVLSQFKAFLLSHKKVPKVSRMQR